MSSLREFEGRLFRTVNPAVRFSVTRYVFAIGIFLAVVVFGLISALGLGVDLLPSVNIPVVAVTTTWSGATPGVMDQQVTSVVEDAISTLSGITDLNASSSTGLSRVVVLFGPDTDQASDANQVAAQVSAATRRLPTGVTAPVVQTFNPNSAPILQFGLTAGATNLAEVNDWATNVLIPLLVRVPGVAAVTVDGAPTRQFQVLLNPDRLAYYNLPPQQVVSAISASDLNQSIGSIVSHGSTMTFATQNVPTRASQIAAVVADPARGVTVGDLGTVRDISAPTNYARVNGVPAVLLSVQQTADSNAVAVAAAVRGLIGQTPLPRDYAVTWSNDTTVPIQASINATFHELAITALAVAFVVLLFLGRLNTAISVILAIPIALSAAPVLYHLLGFTFNQVSLLAMLVAIGVVVDDSIVVAENIERHRVLGMGRREAVLAGASEVFSAVAAASLSLLSVLLPVSFIGGFAGRYLQQFSLGLAAAVFFSWLEALLFLTVRMAYTPDTEQVGWAAAARRLAGLPASFRWGLKSWRHPAALIGAAAVLAVLAITRHYTWLPLLLAWPIALGVLHYVVRVVMGLLEALTLTLHGWTEAALDWVRSGYTRSLGRVLPNSGWVLGGAAVFLVVVAVLVVPRIPFNFVPQTDSGTMRVNLRLAPGTATSVTNDVTGRLESYLVQQKEVQTIQSVVGSGGVFAGANQSSNATITVTLTPVQARQSIFQLIPRYRPAMLALMHDQASPGLSLSAGGGFGGFGSALDLNITSSDLALLAQRNAQIISALQPNRYVVDVTSSISQTILENNFTPIPARLEGTGISPATVADALETYTSGLQAGTVQIGTLSYPIIVQANPVRLPDSQSLLNLPVYSPTLKTNLQVGQLGTLSLAEAPVSISRANRLYTAQLALTLRPDAPPQLAMQTDIQKQLTAAGLLGSGVDLVSSSRNSPAALAAQLATTGPLTFLLALFLAYLVMGAQFNSFRFPIYLLLPVPLAVIGALVLVFIIGGGLDIFGFLGLLLLIGLSAKNAILYLDFVVDRMKHLPFTEALVEAARLRFRPIVMTTITVLIISIPLVASSGAGSEFGQRLGVVMLGGIVFSAILTFFVVPAAFYLFERKRAHAPVAEALEAPAMGPDPQVGPGG